MYTDAQTAELIAAAVEVTQLPYDELLFAIGEAQVDVVADDLGYADLLRALDSSFFDLLKNFNTLYAVSCGSGRERVTINRHS